MHLTLEGWQLPQHEGVIEDLGAAFRGATLQRLDAGDPAVGVCIVATALWLIKHDAKLRNLAAPEEG